MKILLFGADGQVGWELQRSLAPLGEVVALGSSGGYGLVGNFLDPDGVMRTVKAVKPDVVVNAAAYTSVDKAEAEPAVARQVNASTPGMLALATRSCNALLVHYSSDYVFDGSGRTPWREVDEARPLNVYGLSKLEGERLITRCHPNHLILRTAWVYAARGNNFAKTMLRMALQRDRLSVIADQIGAPTGADLLADLTAHLVRTSATRTPVLGIYHAAAAGETSWHGYASFVLERARAAGLVLKVAPEGINPIEASAYPTAAARPANSRLNTLKLRSASGLVLPAWQAGVDRMLSEVIPQEGNQR